ncbi:MAG: hypothetical protein K6L73_01980 [Cellvibrionaceae bacterium]
MSLDIYQIIIINLGLLLLLSWGLGFISIAKMMKDKEALKESLQRARKQLNEALAIQQQNEKEELPTPLPAEASAPAASTEQDDNTDAEYDALVDTILKLTDSMSDKDERLKRIQSIKEQQEELIEKLQSNQPLSADQETALLDSTEEQDRLIKLLRNDLSITTDNLHDLQRKLHDARRSLKLAEMDREDSRLKANLKKLRMKNQALTEDLIRLQGSDKKAWNLQARNSKLVERVQSLSKDSMAQRNTIEQLNFQLRQQIQAEKELMEKVDHLEKQLDSEADNSKLAELDKDLKHVQEELERTLREKNFIESHMIELDKSIEEARKQEIQLEDDYGMTEDSLEDLRTQSESTTAPDTIEDGRSPEEIAKENKENKDKSLYNALTSFWSQHVPTPIVFVDNQYNRSNRFNRWTQIAIGEGNNSLLIGIDGELERSLAAGLLSMGDDKLKPRDLDKAISTLGRTITENIASNYFPNQRVTAPEFLRHEDAQVLMQHSKPAAEILTSSRKLPIYIALLED